MQLPELINSIPELKGEADVVVIAQRLNQKPLVENPEKQQQTVKPVASIAEVFAIIQQSGSPTTDMAVVGQIAQMIQAGQIIGEFVGIPALGDAVSLTQLLTDSGLSPAASAAINKRLEETEPDPDYQEKIPGQSLAEEHGLGVVTKAQIIEAID